MKLGLALLVAAALLFASSAAHAQASPNTCQRQGVNIDVGSVLTAGIASVNGADQLNCNYRGLVCVINVTAITGTSPTMTFTIQGKDATNGNYYPILASAALAATGVVVLRAYPGLTVASNLTANDIVPRNWRMITTAGGTVATFAATTDCQLEL